MEPKGKVAIIGSGLIGRSWALLFISAGYRACLYDNVESKIDEALRDIRTQLEHLYVKELLRGPFSTDSQFSLVCGTSSLCECMKDVTYVQECIFEDLEAKKAVWHQIDAIAKEDVILASSTSCFLPSLISESLRNKAQFLVVHPINPPYFVPLVEIIPAPWTNKHVVMTTRCLLLELGQKPVIVKKEVPGFIVNRLQYAILNECYRLIRDEVISVEECEAVMSEGLGMRYFFMGPWETAHLNAQGMKDYFEKYAEGIYNVSKTFGEVCRMEGPTVERIISIMTRKMPIETLPARRRLRDEKLGTLCYVKKHDFDRRMIERRRF